MLQRYQQALDDSIQAIKTDTSYSKAYMRAAKCCLALGEYDRARAILREPQTNRESGVVAVLADVNKCEKLRHMASQLSKTKPQLALQFLDQLLQAGNSPASTDGRLLHVEALLGLDRLDEAKRIADTLYAEDSRNADILLMRGHCFHKMGDLDEAAKHMQGALSINPDYPSAATVLKQIRAEKAKTQPKSARHAAQAAAASSEAQTADAGAADAAPASTGRALARAEMEKAAGTKRYTAGDFDEAIQHYTTALSLLPATAPANTRAVLHSNLAACHMTLDEYDAGLREALLSIESDASFSKAYLRASKCYLAQGKYEQARHMLKQTKDELAPAVSGNIDMLEKMQAHSAELAKVDPIVAIKQLLVLLQGTPANVKAHLMRIQSLLDSEQLVMAKHAADTLYEDNSRNVDVLYIRGLCMYQQGDLDEAATQMQSLLSFEPEHQAAAKLLDDIEAHLAVRVPVFPIVSYLPAALLLNVCHFLSTEDLLTTLARTSKATRELLTPASFSAHLVRLDAIKLRKLASHNLHSPFYARALSDCLLRVDYTGLPLPNFKCVFVALSHFPACQAVQVQAPQPTELPDTDLQALLRHPTVRQCSQLLIAYFRRKAESVLGPNDERRQVEQQFGFGQLDAERRKVPFKWSDYSLANLTRLHLDLAAQPVYQGGVQFLIQHSAILELELSLSVVGIKDLCELFANAAALPQLTGLTLHNQNRETVHSLDELVTVLATTKCASGKPRPVDTLSFVMGVTREVLSAAALLPQLHSFRALAIQGGWLEEWLKVRTALSHLQLFLVHTVFGVLHQPAVVSAPNLLPFFEAMADCPLHTLDIRTGERVQFGADTIAQFARLDKLREMKFTLGTRQEENWVDLSNPAPWTSFTAGCLRSLTRLTLQNVRLSAGSVSALAAGVPQLEYFYLAGVELSCHPAVVYAYFAGYCERMEDIDVSDSLSHTWSGVHAGEVIEAYQSAVTTSPSLN